ncbi:MAG: FAD binding domain-containing protein [Aestuariivita sp.]|nr:FAD binding domain-containing protein [Aestuariivita sp.]
MYDFTYRRPRSVKEAEEFLRTSFEPQLLAGGMSLLPSMKVRLSAPSTLVDLSDLSELKRVKVENGQLEIGAMIRHFNVLTDAKVIELIPGLSELASGIADHQVRYRGTIGGSMANADPAADYPAAALALNAEFITNHRRISCDDFFLGMFTNALDESEILCRISFRIPLASCYIKIPHPSSGYAMTGAFVAKYEDGYQIGVTGAASTYFRHCDMEIALNNGAKANECLKIAAPDNDYISDIHASAAYRQNLVRVVIANAIEKLHSLDS